MAVTYPSPLSVLPPVPPVIAELQAIFDTLPDSGLLAALRGPTRRGPKGHNVQSLWRCYIAFYYLGLPSVSDLVRLLHDNPYIAKACGVEGGNPKPADLLAVLGETRQASLHVRRAARSVGTHGQAL